MTQIASAGAQWGRRATNRPSWSLYANRGHLSRKLPTAGFKGENVIDQKRVIKIECVDE